MGVLNIYYIMLAHNAPAYNREENGVCDSAPGAAIWGFPGGSTRGRVCGDAVYDCLVSISRPISIVVITVTY